MSEININNTVEQPSEKSFGVIFSIIFLLVALYPLINSEGLRIWSLIVSIIFFLLAFLSPKLLALPNKLWFKFGLLIGSIVAPILMTLIYVFTVVPTGLIMRLLGKDLLKQNIMKNTQSYWIERKQPMGSMKNQF